jgi:hypothetical protein
MYSSEMENIGQEILNKAEIKEEKFGSVIAVLMIISIILTVIRVIQECDKNELSGMNLQQQTTLYHNNIKHLSLRKSWMTRMRLKKIIRQKLSKEDYRTYGNKICNAIFDFGTTINESQTQSIIEALNHD